MSKTKKKILFLSPYPEHSAPSQRLKYEQYFSRFEENGFEVETSAFVSKELWSILYQEGKFITKAWYLFLGYFRRINDLIRIRQYDIVYVHLWVTPIGTPIFERIVRMLAKRLIYDIDDMVFLGHSSSANKFFKFLKGRNKMIELMKSSDHVITCTPILDKVVRKHNLNTTDISSSINTNVYKFKSKSINPAKIVLGWSGSHSTSKYLHLLDNVIIRLSKEFNIELKVIGDDSFKIPAVNVNAISWMEQDEVVELHKIDIGLYPLPDEEWVMGKSGLKALQYMSLGIPTVATALGANFRVVENNVSGILVDPLDEEGWYQSIKKIIEDRDLYNQFSVEGRKRVESYYSLDANFGKYLKAIWRPIDVSMLIHSLERGGAEKVLSILAEQLSKTKNVEIVLLSNIINQKLSSNISVKYIMPNNLNWLKFKVIGVCIAAVRYKSYLEKNKIKTSISFLNRPNFINVLASANNSSIETIINERSYPPEAYKIKNFVNWSTKMLIDLLYPKANAIICNSQLTSQYFKDRFNEKVLDKIRVWQNPIIIEDIAIKPRIYSKKSPFKILAVGRLDKNKNHKLLINALSRIENLDVELHILGKGSERKSLMQLRDKLHLQSKVIFHDQVYDTTPYYKAADVFILSSFFEGFPNVIIEAMSNGVPIISTDCKSGPREILNIDDNIVIDKMFCSKYGVITPVNDEVEMVSAITNLLGSPEYYNSLCVSGFERIKALKKSQAQNIYNVDFSN